MRKKLNFNGKKTNKLNLIKGNKDCEYIRTGQNRPQDMEILQQDARTPIKDIAKEVFLTSPAVSARINRLVEEGYIVGFHAEINPKKLGYHIKAFINLEVQPEDKSEFYPYIEKCPNVIECNCVTGDYSMILEVQFPSTTDLDQFIGELQEFGRTKTLIVFSTNVEHRGVWVQE